VPTHAPDRCAARSLVSTVRVGARRLVAPDGRGFSARENTSVKQLNALPTDGPLLAHDHIHSRTSRCTKVLVKGSAVGAGGVEPPSSSC
jgi:hypothetical protein